MHTTIAEPQDIGAWGDCVRRFAAQGDVFCWKNFLAHTKFDDGGIGGRGSRKPYKLQRRKRTWPHNLR